MKLKYGKLAIELVITAILSAVILGLVNYILGLITVAESWNYLYTFLIAIVSVAFFVMAMKINPGKEEFLTSIPIVILSLSIVGLLRHWINVIPTLTLEFSWVALAWGLGSVFLASSVTKKYILKILK